MTAFNRMLNQWRQQANHILTHPASSTPDQRRLAIRFLKTHGVAHV